MINDFRGKYAFLSNFYESPVSYYNPTSDETLTFLNAEAAFQSQKTLNCVFRRRFQFLNPSEAKGLGRNVALRQDWEDVKENVMYEVVKAKFFSNEELAHQLLATGNEHLEEGNTWGDRAWGTVDGVGANKLGIILMKVREELRNV